MAGPKMLEALFVKLYPKTFSDEFVKVINGSRSS